MKAILLGATGLIGGLILKQLLDDPAFSKVKLISRRSAGIQHPKLEEVIINFEDKAVFKKEVTGVDVVFSCVGTTQKQVKGDNALYRSIDFDIPVNAAKFCAEQHIGKYLLVSSVGANAASKNFYLRLKGETENAILSQSLETIYIMRPSILIGNRNESRPLEIISTYIMKFISVLLIGGTSKYKAIEAKDVALAMVTAAKNTATGKFICHYNEMKRINNRQ